jgi:hypothetical protein
MEHGLATGQRHIQRCSIHEFSVNRGSYESTCTSRPAASGWSNKCAPGNLPTPVRKAARKVDLPDD